MQILPEWIKIKQCTKLITHDIRGKENGFLIDILNRHDSIFQGREEELFQQVYYSSVNRGLFKGFHIHPLKYDSVTCVSGEALLVFYPGAILKEELAKKIDVADLLIVPIDTIKNVITVSFPSKYPHGYYGVSEAAYILNYRNPAWHPGDTEQYDYRLDGIEDYLEKWVMHNADS